MRSAPATWFCIKGVCVEGLSGVQRWLGLRVGSAERERKGIRRYGIQVEGKKRRKKGRRDSVVNRSKGFVQMEVSAAELRLIPFMEVTLRCQVAA